MAVRLRVAIYGVSGDGVNGLQHGSSRSPTLGESEARTKAVLGRMTPVSLIVSPSWLLLDSFASLFVGKISVEASRVCLGPPCTSFLGPVVRWCPRRTRSCRLDQRCTPQVAPTTTEGGGVYWAWKELLYGAVRACRRPSPTEMGLAALHTTTDAKKHSARKSACQRVLTHRIMCAC